MKNVYKPIADSEKFLFHLYANLEDAALKEGNGELAKKLDRRCRDHCRLMIKFSGLAALKTGRLLDGPGGAINKGS